MVGDVGVAGGVRGDRLGAHKAQVVGAAVAGGPTPHAVEAESLHPGVGVLDDDELPFGAERDAARTAEPRV